MTTDNKSRGLQSFDRQLADIVDNNIGHGGNRYKLDKEGLIPEKSLDESHKKALEVHPVTSTKIERNEAQKEHERKVLADEEELTLDRAVRKVQDQVKGSFAKSRFQPLCDITTAKRLLWTSYAKYAEEHQRGLVFSDNLKAVIQLLVPYFTGNKSEVLDPNKGIYLWGPCGTGKSILMEMIQNVLVPYKYPMAYRVKRVPDIFEQATGRKDVDFSRYHSHHYCFDDMGFDEQVVNHYGNRINPMESILTRRYPSFQKRGVLTHATSNLPWTSTTGPSMADRLNERIISRGSEMFNFVLLKGDDLRKKK